MPKLVTEKDVFSKAFITLEQDIPTGITTWLEKLKRDAADHFKQLGLPIQRRGNEEWKYTDLSPIAKIAFSPIEKFDSKKLKQEVLDYILLGNPSWNRLLFVDGNFEPDLSFVNDTDNIILKNIQDVVADKSYKLEQHLSKYKDYSNNAFVALNTAFIKDGAFIQIADNRLVKEPIHIIYITTASQPETASYPRTLILGGKGSQAEIIESYWGLDNEAYLTNAVTEIFVGQAASIKYYKLELQNENAFHISNTQVVQDSDSYFSSVNIDIGGKLVRNNIDFLTAGENTNSLFNGLYLINATQHVDNQVILDHAKPYTTSRELYKGVLGGKSRSVFHGSIIVRPGAVKVNAMQVDKNLLLSDKAEADTKPAFWIYCDDVKCGHGAACGQIDDQALFYLRSRGIDEETARNFLTRGFVNEIIDGIDNEDIRIEISSIVQAKLENIR